MALPHHVPLHLPSSYWRPYWPLCNRFHCQTVNLITKFYQHKAHSKKKKKKNQLGPAWNVYVPHPLLQHSIAAVRECIAEIAILEANQALLLNISLAKAHYKSDQAKAYRVFMEHAFVHSTME